MNFYNHLYLRLYKVNSYHHLYSYLYDMDFYCYLYSHHYVVDFYSHPYWYLYEVFYTNISTDSYVETFLRRLYEYIPTVTPIPLKPEMFLQYIRRSVIIQEQVKPESPESWIPSLSSLQHYVKWFDKFVTYYMFDHNFIVDTCGDISWPRKGKEERN